MGTSAAGQTLGRTSLATPLLLAAVAVSAVATSVPGALSRSFWGDEIASTRIVTDSSLHDVLEDVRRTESTPPIWYGMAWGVAEADRALPGNPLLNPLERLRLLSVVFASLAAVLTALWAIRLLHDPMLGAFAGALVALGSVPAAYAEQLRAYAFLTLLAAAFGVLLASAAARPSTRLVVALAGTTCVGLLTHYFFAFTVLAGVAWLWASRPRRAGRRRSTLALAIACVGFLPWLPSLLDQYEGARYRWIGSFDLESVVSLPGSLFLGLDGVSFGLMRIALVIAIAAGVVALWRRHDESALIVWLGLLPIGAAGLVWALGQPIFNERNLLVVAPSLAVLAASGLLLVPHGLRTGAAIVGIAVTVMGSWVTHATLGSPDYRGVARTLVSFGWDPDRSIALDTATRTASLRAALGWYLPCRPQLATSGRNGRHRTLFAIGHSSDLGHWLALHGGSAERFASFASYDHPFRGRENGRILVVRFKHPVEVPDALLLKQRLVDRGSCVNDMP